MRNPSGQSDSLKSGKNNVPSLSLLHLYMLGHDMIAVILAAILKSLLLAAMQPQ